MKEKLARNLFKFIWMQATLFNPDLHCKTNIFLFIHSALFASFEKQDMR